jgi:phospholipid/cholesterol/gamma-HCH transport system permease protein
MLDAQGIDPFLFFILPRSLATSISMFCLNVAFIITALLTGYLIGSLVDPSDTTLLEFLNEVLAAMGMGEYAIIVLKPLITGLIISLITCTSGLSVGDHARQVADILPLGYVKSVLAVFLVSGTLTVLL